GGSHSPLRQQGRNGVTPTGAWAPVVMIQSLTPPDQFGYPRGFLQFQWGSGALEAVRAACCYIGIRWLVAGSSNNVPLIYDGDTAKFLGISSLTSVSSTSDSTSAAVSFTVPGLPVVSTVMRIGSRRVGANSSGTYLAKAPPTSAMDEILELTEASTFYEVETKAQSTLYHKNLTTGDTLYVRLRSVNMNIPRLSR
ncbi:MAG: hypothetical protein ABFE07_09300, partial [Armatimonadia bacterium]